MWTALYDISARESCTIHELCTLIHLRKRADSSLTASIRVFLMLYYKAAATEDGHRKSGHGDFEMMKARARVNSDMYLARRAGMALRQAPTPLRPPLMPPPEVAAAAMSKPVMPSARPLAS